MDRPHRPVLVAEVVEVLSGKRVVVDATLGAGGHAEALLEQGGVERVIGIDRDPDALAEARSRLKRFGPRFREVEARFSEVERVAGELGLSEVGGVLFDLGVSSMQLDRSDRGFSYRGDGPLDMRMSPHGPTAADVVNGYAEEDLARVIFEYGEDRQSRRIAAAIVRARERAPITTTGQLASVVASAVGRRPGRAHPARRTFQAIRIEVNGELEELAASLPRAAGLLEQDGRLVVISYHSLEDRAVKRFMAGAPELQLLAKKPAMPSAAEQAANPRARSARLRAARRTEEEAA